MTCSRRIYFISYRGLRVKIGQSASLLIYTWDFFALTSQYTTSGKNLSQMRINSTNLWQKKSVFRIHTQYKLTYHRLDFGRIEIYIHIYIYIYKCIYICITFTFNIKKIDKYPI